MIVPGSEKMILEVTAGTSVFFFAPRVFCSACFFLLCVFSVLLYKTFIKLRFCFTFAVSAKEPRVSE